LHWPQIAFVNQRHVTEQFLNEAITTIVNTYVQLATLAPGSRDLTMPPIVPALATGVSVL
jgi:hypothetical protein